MKELSIEEKAKAYDEAIIKAKEWKPGLAGNGDIKTCINELFPSLKESDDEKISKALVKYFTSSIENSDYEICGIPFKEVLYWLEKQGEQKPVEWSEEDKKMISMVMTDLNLAHYVVRKGVAEKEHKKEIEWLESLKDRCLPQPNPEWSEEDDKMINSIAVHLNATTGGFPEDRAWADKFMIWLKSLKDRCLPQQQSTKW